MRCYIYFSGVTNFLNLVFLLMGSFFFVPVGGRVCFSTSLFGKAN
uniref:Uncharacterized protein n=1 Tax=Anguilla anguilla TaxID=7936 RepID=A0A0E9RXE2_ANGAN